MNDLRVDLLRGLGTFGETTGESTIGSGVSSGGEGVLAIGTPLTMIISLRRLGEGGESEVNPGLRDESGKAGNVADLAWRRASKRSSGNATCRRLRVDLDRWCLTPPSFWIELEGGVAGFVFTLFERAAVVTAGVRTGEAGIGVNGGNVNGEVKLAREVRATPPLFCVCVSEVGWSEGSCNREPEGLLRTEGAGIE